MIWTNVIINMFREMDLQLLEILGDDFDQEILEHLEESEIEFSQDLLLGRLMRAALMAEGTTSDQINALVNKHKHRAEEDPLWQEVHLGLEAFRGN